MHNSTNRLALETYALSHFCFGVSLTYIGFQRDLLEFSAFLCALDHTFFPFFWAFLTYIGFHKGFLELVAPHLDLSPLPPSPTFSGTSDVSLASKTFSIMSALQTRARCHNVIFLTSEGPCFYEGLPRICCFALRLAYFVTHFWSFILWRLTYFVLQWPHRTCCFAPRLIHFCQQFVLVMSDVPWLFHQGLQKLVTLHIVGPLAKYFVTHLFFWHF